MLTVLYQQRGLLKGECAKIYSVLQTNKKERVSTLLFLCFQLKNDFDDDAKKALQPERLAALFFGVYFF